MTCSPTTNVDRNLDPCMYKLISTNVRYPCMMMDDENGNTLGQKHEIRWYFQEDGVILIKILLPRPP